MAQVITDIPTAQVDRVVTALAAKVGVAVPGTTTEKQAFVKNAIKDFLIEATRAHETQEALQALVVTAVDIT